MGKVHIPGYLLILIDGDGDHVYDLNTVEEREELKKSLVEDEGYDPSFDQILFVDLDEEEPVVYHAAVNFFFNK